MKRTILALAILLAGCSGSRETSSTHTATPAAKSESDRYERTFAPSDHDPESDAAHTQTGLVPGTAGGTTDTSSASVPEMISGYRVQLLATTDIDEVTSRKTTLENAFPTEWFYIEFDPPVYKLRAGNFPTRMDADRFARALAAQGYTDAWAVPERVFKNPAPVPAKPALPMPNADSSAAKQ